jgi:hypothetical protein
MTNNQKIFVLIQQLYFLSKYIQIMSKIMMGMKINSNYFKILTMNYNKILF